MQCPSCGALASRALSYCNQCGARLDAEQHESLTRTTELRFESFIMAGMVGLFVFGLVAIAVLLGVMKAVLGLEAGQIIAFALLSFLVMLGLEGIFVWRLLRGPLGADRNGRLAPAKQRRTSELDGPQPQALPVDVPVVTEQTTRSFEPIYDERTPE